VEARAPWPLVSDDEPPSSFLVRFEAWRASVSAVEAELRKKGTAARQAEAALRKLGARAGDDTALLPALPPAMKRALRELEVYERFTAFALQLACRKGGNAASKSDQAMEAAAFQLYMRGVSKLEIARLLRLNRRNVQRTLRGADEIAETMRASMKLSPRPLR
jgi:hypothetical protein